MLVRIERRQDHDFRSCSTAAYLLGSRESIDARHPNVHQNDVWLRLIDSGWHSRTVSDVPNEEDAVGAAEHHAQRGSDERVVVDNQDSYVRRPRFESLMLATEGSPTAETRARLP
jgi:hypothetical protein